MKQTILASMLFLLWATTGIAQWSTDPAQNFQILRGSVYPQMITDGTGGAIVVGVSFTVRPHLYAQRVDQLGKILWSQSLVGSQVSDAGVQQALLGAPFLKHLVISDNAGGAYVAFHALWVVGHYEEPPEEIYSFLVYVQHIDANGNLLFGNEGLPVLYRAPVDTGGQALTALIKDDAEGFYIVFGDQRGPEGAGWYIARVKSDGTQPWGLAKKLNGVRFDSELISYEDGLGGFCIYELAVETVPPGIFKDHFLRINSVGEIALFEEIEIGVPPYGFAYAHDFVHNNGEAIFVWRDFRTDSVRMQKLDRDGSKLWGDIPKFLGRSWAQSYIFFFIDRDHVGGCYLNYPSSTGSRLLHIQYDGNISWENTFDAIALLNMGSANVFGITAILYPSWYLQKFDLNGKPIWPGDGVLFTIRQSSRGYPLTIHGSDGIIVAWDELAPLRGTWMQQISYDGKLGMVTSVEEKGDSKYPATSSQLHPNYPNPFNAVTTFVYETEKTAHIELTIYDVLGSKIITLIDESKTAGKYKIIWDGQDAQKRAVTTGIYFARFKANHESRVHKLLLIRYSYPPGEPHL